MRRTARRQLSVNPNVVVSKTSGRDFAPLPTEFEWGVNGAGYEWRGPAGARRKLFPSKAQLVVEDARGGRQPLREHAALFKTFAAIELSDDDRVSEENMITFADQFGPLMNIEAGDQFYRWYAEILVMKLAVTLWEQRNDIDAIRTVLTAAEN